MKIISVTWESNHHSLFTDNDDDDYATFTNINRDENVYKNHETYLEHYGWPPSKKNEKEIRIKRLLFAIIWGHNILTNSSQVSSRKPLFCRPLKFLSQIAGRAEISVINLSTSRLANAASELIVDLSFSSRFLFLILHFNLWLDFFLLHAREDIF